MPGTPTSVPPCAKPPGHPITHSHADFDESLYHEHRREGLSVIAVGGNKLPSALTLEGLTVSYYLQASKTFSTLLQMDRWFGYRPGYEDLCRLYTTTTLMDACIEITVANDELRHDLAALEAMRYIR